MMLEVSASPHIRDHASSRSIMIDVCLALLPALAVSYYVFGPRAIVLTLVTVLSAVLFEYLSRRLMKRQQTVNDFSAVVTGLLLAYNFPAGLPYWMAVVGSLIAIVVSKQLFGGIGKNFTNPALSARIILLASFPQQMTNFVVSRHILEGGGLEAFDLVAAPTRLALIRSGEMQANLKDLFLGLRSGCIGEVSCAALLLGAAYLLYKKVITPWIPLTFLGTTMFFVCLFGQDPLVHLMSGGLILGAFFMATDYVTSPYTRKGQIVFGIGCGLLTGLIRIYGGMTEGVSFSILIMNILTPHINSLTLGYPRKVKKEARS